MLLLLSSSLISAADPPPESAVGKRDYKTFSGSENEYESESSDDYYSGSESSVSSGSGVPASSPPSDYLEQLAAGLDAEESDWMVHFTTEYSVEVPPPGLVDFDRDQDLIHWWGVSAEFRAYFSSFPFAPSPAPHYEFSGTDQHGEPKNRKFLFFSNVGKPVEQHFFMSPLRIMIYIEFLNTMFGAGSAYQNVPEFIEKGFIDLNRPLYELDWQYYRAITFAHLSLDPDCKLPFAYLQIIPKSRGAIDEKSWKGKTLLHAAIERGNERAVSLLLSANANPGILYLHTEGTAAMMAAKRRNAAILKMVAETGRCDPDVNLQMSFSLTKYFFNYQIPEALLVFVHWKGYSTEKLIERLKISLLLAYNTDREFGFRCLQILLPFRQLEPLFLKLLSDFVWRADLKSFAAVVMEGYKPPVSFQVGGKNETYLHMAIRHARYHMIPFIVQSVNANDQLSFEGLTPVKLAIARKDIHALMPLVPCLPKATEQDLEFLKDLLVSAANCGFKMGIMRLLKEFTSIQDIVFREHSLPVFFAKYGSYEMLVAVLSQGNYNPHLPDPKGVILAEVQCPWDLRRTQLIQDYVKCYDSQATMTHNPILRFNL